jgi:hypothetical protein
MTKSSRAQVVELLELAHGYAILGSIMPFKTACVELNLIGSDAAKEAAAAIDLAREEAAKPNPRAYCEAIGAALERVEKGEG